MSVNLVSRKFVFLAVGCIFVLLECTWYLTALEEKKEEKKEEEVLLPGDNITEFVPPFIPLLNDYAVVGGYNLLGCNIRKSMSQLSYNIMCYLNNTEGFLQNNQTLLDTWKIDRISCPGIHWTIWNQMIRAGQVDMSKLTKFAFIRNPEERFASFYVDKCMRAGACENCTDVRCASKLVYDKLMTLVHNQSSILKDNPKYWLEWHAAPQTWNCDFNQYLSDFHLIPIGTAPEARDVAMRKLRKVLEFAGIPHHHIEKIVRDSAEGDTAHATYDSRESEEVLKQVRTDPYIRHYLHRTYYHDYVAFGFNMTGIVDYPQSDQQLPLPLPK
ncbi:unnamed protein product [Caenorhabditis sp. 36 PRJEB53466]|nr:unnamed protein product [Caenorhabditis sp. 36 PRJEB53466]